MTTECYPISTLFPTTKLFREFLALGDAGTASPVQRWYGAAPLAGRWMSAAKSVPEKTAGHRNALADSLRDQSLRFGAAETTLANIEKIRAGAQAVVTGQQVGLLGGPLLTLLKAATAVARAKQVSAATGMEHVPMFWLATEDHDLAEVDQVALLSKRSVEILRLAQKHPHADAPVGTVAFSPEIERVLEEACGLLGYAPVCDLLRECYAGAGPDGAAPTFASSFARLMTKLFSAHGLIVLDASERPFHTLAANTLRYAIENAEQLESALLERTAELEASGYHAQVLVKAGASLLFLITHGADGRPETRQPLRRTADGIWKAGTGATAQTFTAAELLAILDEAPERLSPNALLRPVFQDALLPTTAYVGGPAEIAYFAQSQVIYQQVLGRVTPILPRLTATLIEPAIGQVMDAHELAFPDGLSSAETLAQKLGARAMPIEAKRKLADAGNALDDALKAAQTYLGSLDESLGRSAEVSASKMRYQMNRLRRLAANFELQREGSLRKHADAITLHLYPDGHPQERLLGGAWFLAAWENAHGNPPDGVPGAGLIDRLVVEAANQCPGHLVVRI